jgi:hypothetical protein
MMVHSVVLEEVILVMWNSQMCFRDEFRGSLQRISRISIGLEELSHLAGRTA